MNGRERKRKRKRKEREREISNKKDIEKKTEGDIKIYMYSILSKCRFSPSLTKTCNR